MAEEATNTFLDVPTLLGSSALRAGKPTLLYVGGIFLLVMLLSAYAGSSGGRLLEGISTLGMMGLVVGMGLLTWRGARSVQREQQRMEAIDELMQLRRWDEAAGMLENALSRPMRTPQARLQGLVYLGAVLARYHRYGDAVAVYDHLLGLGMHDEDTDYGLRLGRAMSLLHDDRLFDADRAIGELRRISGERWSGGLALLEIYRDVKTGHPREAIEAFEARVPEIKEQLGYRLADAMALVARAYDMLEMRREALGAYQNATMLVSAAELERRYVEVAALSGKYEAAHPPAGEAA